MIAMFSVALAISITAGLAAAVSSHLGERVESMTSEASIVPSGLELKKLGANHAFLHGMVINDGTEGVIISSVEIFPPDSEACGADFCAISANFTRNGGLVCRIGSYAGSCEDCSRSCMLHPGESLSLGPTPHRIGIIEGASYIIAINAETARNDPVAAVHSVRAR